MLYCSRAGQNSAGCLPCMCQRYALAAGLGVGEARGAQNYPSALMHEPPLGQKQQQRDMGAAKLTGHPRTSELHHLVIFVR